MNDTSKSKEPKKKFQDWEYMLKSAIYLSLIGYNDSNGYTIPCKTRGEIEDAILGKFKKSLSKDNYTEPQASKPSESLTPEPSREAELEKCLGELTSEYEKLCKHTSRFYELNGIPYKEPELITRSKSLLNPDKTDL